MVLGMKASKRIALSLTAVVVLTASLAIAWLLLPRRVNVRPFPADRFSTQVA